MTTESTAWLSLVRAAQHLGTAPKTLRKRIERAAQPSPDGTLEARVDGLRCRKLGRLWMIQLGPWGTR